MLLRARPGDSQHGADADASSSAGAGAALAVTENRDPDWLRNQEETAVASGELTQADVDAARAERNRRRWNADQPTVEIQAIYDCAKMVGRAVDREPNNVGLNVAARLLRSIGLLLRRVEDAKRDVAQAHSDDARAAARERVQSLEALLRSWLMTSPKKGKPSPDIYASEHASSPEEGWDQLVEMPQPPVVKVDQPAAFRRLVEHAQMALDEGKTGQSLGERMVMGVSIHFAPFASGATGMLSRCMVDAAPQIATFASSGPWSLEGRKADRLAVAALIACGMPKDRANGLAK
jgi:hypothetical protein